MGTDEGIEVAATLQPPRGFDAACRMVVDYLAEAIPMSVWAVTRVVDDEWVVLASADPSAGLSPGTTLPWRETLCRPMVAGRIPRIVPDTSALDELTDTLAALASRRIAVGAYVGTPIVGSDGQLFGTVCGADPGTREDAAGHEELLDLLSSLLSAVLDADVSATESARALETAVTDAETDALTGLLNRRGWDRWLEREEDRFRRFGDPASVIMLDLDQLKRVNDTQGHSAGDRYIQRTARALLGALRQSDALARLGGDEFAMVVRAGEEDARHLVDRLQKALEDAGVLGSFGVAPYRVVTGFPEACAAADAAMYENKRARRLARV